jgi:hypothetical protein
MAGKADYLWLTVRARGEEAIYRNGGSDLQGAEEAKSHAE